MLLISGRRKNKELKISGCLEVFLELMTKPRRSVVYRVLAFNPYNAFVVGRRSVNINISSNLRLL